MNTPLTTPISIPIETSKPKTQQNFNLIFGTAFIAFFFFLTTLFLAYQNVQLRSVETQTTSIQSSSAIVCNSQFPGIKGQVTVREGNCMPMIAGSHNSCSSRTFATTIFVHSPTKRVPVQDKNGNYTQSEPEHTAILKQVTTDADGNYSINLPNGTYSLLINDNGKESCYSSDEKGILCPVTVQDNCIVHNIGVNHAAD